MSAVRPEFGPTLPELLRPRLARMPRLVRLGLAAVLALLIAGVAARVLTAGDGERTIAVTEPIGFRFGYLPPLHERRPHPGELARVGGSGQSFAVRELRLPAYRGDAAGFLPLYATRLNAEMARQFPGYRWRAEGRANINRIQGYEILFRFRGPGGRRMFGRRELLLPASTARHGVDLLLLARRSKAVRTVGEVGGSGALKRALRSFELEGADQS
jgi:hypothetical protein